MTAAAAAPARTYRVTHRTAYTYDRDVTASYGRAYLLPRDAPGQRCLDSAVEVSPGATLVREATDYFGNRSAYFEVQTAHTVLDVTSRSTVTVDRGGTDLAGLDDWTWRRAAQALARRDAPATAEWLLPSPLVPSDAAVAGYAGAVFRRDRPLGEALAGLMHAIHGDFTYRAGATSVATPLAEVLRRREGVCQDFAHLAVGCLRAAGLAARYVSGYLETDPPPGGEKLQGSDASHAWASVLVPDLGWVDLDPTNDQIADARYVVTAWGRDYTDVPPLKGVIFTESTTSTLRVEVDVTRVASQAGPPPGH